MGLCLARCDEMQERRRDAVSRAEFDDLVEKVDANTSLTKESVDLAKEVKGLLLGFKVMMHIGKWVTVIATMIAAVAAAWHSIKGG